MFQTIMPLIINTHGHLGILKGTTMPSANYTEENIVLDKNPSESIGSTEPSERFGRMVRKPMTARS
jgi:hypothetical protein